MLAAAQWASAARSEPNWNGCSQPCARFSEDWSGRAGAGRHRDLDRSACLNPLRPVAPQVMSAGCVDIGARLIIACRFRVANAISVCQSAAHQREGAVCSPGVITRFGDARLPKPAHSLRQAVYCASHWRRRDHRRGWLGDSHELLVTASSLSTCNKRRPEVWTSRRYPASMPSAQTHRTFKAIAGIAL